MRPAEIMTAIKRSWITRGVHQPIDEILAVANFLNTVRCPVAGEKYPGYLLLPNLKDYCRDSAPAG